MSNYYRTGRGGAGNFKTAEEVKKERNLEAQEQIDAANLIAAENQRERHPDEYQHGGRGGFGNYFSPSSIVPAPPPAPEEQPDPITTTTAAAIAAAQGQEAPKMRMWSGRGGAGNYVPPVEREEGREMEDKEAEGERLSEGVREKVEMVLERPGRVYVPGERER